MDGFKYLISLVVCISDLKIIVYRVIENYLRIAANRNKAAASTLATSTLPV